MFWLTKIDHSPNASWLNLYITLEWAHKQFILRVHILFYFLHDIANPSIMRKMTIFTHLTRLVYVLLMSSQLIADDITNAFHDLTIVTVSNVCTIYFIHIHFHCWSCKKLVYSDLATSLILYGKEFRLSHLPCSFTDIYVYINKVGLFYHLLLCKFQDSHLHLLIAMCHYPG